MKFICRGQHSIQTLLLLNHSSMTLASRGYERVLPQALLPPFVVSCFQLNRQLTCHSRQNLLLLSSAAGINFPVCLVLASDICNNQYTLQAWTTKQTASHTFNNRRPYRATISTVSASLSLGFGSVLLEQRGLPRPKRIWTRQSSWWLQHNRDRKMMLLACVFEVSCLAARLELTYQTPTASSNVSRRIVRFEYTAN